MPTRHRVQFCSLQISHVAVLSQSKKLLLSIASEQIETFQQPVRAMKYGRCISPVECLGRLTWLEIEARSYLFFFFTEYSVDVFRHDWWPFSPVRLLLLFSPVDFVMFVCVVVFHVSRRMARHLKYIFSELTESFNSVQNNRMHRLTNAAPSILSFSSINPYVNCSTVDSWQHFFFDFLNANSVQNTNNQQKRHFLFTKKN